MRGPTPFTYWTGVESSSMRQDSVGVKENVSRNRRPVPASQNGRLWVLSVNGLVSTIIETSLKDTGWSLELLVTLLVGKEFKGRGSRVKSKNPSRFLDDVRAKQRNTVWPDTIRNGRSVDRLLWKGSPNATRVQRIGIAIFGMVFLILGLMITWLANVAAHRRSIGESLLTFLVAFVVLTIACRLLTN